VVARRHCEVPQAPWQSRLVPRVAQKPDGIIWRTIVKLPGMALYLIFT